MDPLIQMTLTGFVFGGAALVVFWISMRSDRWVDAHREKKQRDQAS